MASMAVTRMARRAGSMAEIRTVRKPTAAATASAGRETEKRSGIVSPNRLSIRSPSSRKVTHIPPQPASKPSGMPIRLTVWAS